MLDRRNTYRRAAGSPFTLFTSTLAQGQRTLQTRKRESDGPYGVMNQETCEKTAVWRLTPSSANAVCGARNTKMSRLRYSYSMWLIYTHTSRHLQKEI